MDADRVEEWKDRYIDFRAIAECPPDPQYQGNTGMALKDVAGASPPGTLGAPNDGRKRSTHWAEVADYVSERSPLLAERRVRKQQAAARRSAMQHLLEDEVRKVNEWAEQQLAKFSAAVKNLEKYSRQYKGMPAQHQVCCDSSACRSAAAVLVAAIVAQHLVYL